jgi:hypothetical protein
MIHINIMTTTIWRFPKKKHPFIDGFSIINHPYFCHLWGTQKWQTWDPPAVSVSSGRLGVALDNSKKNRGSKERFRTGRTGNDGKGMKDMR